MRIVEVENYCFSQVVSVLSHFSSLLNLKSLGLINKTKMGRNTSNLSEAHEGELSFGIDTLT